MSQKDINTSIDALFDEFIKSGSNIDNMNTKNTDINKLKKTVTFNEVLDEGLVEASNEVSNEVLDTDIYTDVETKTYYNDNTQKLDFTNSFIGDLLNNFLLYFKKKNNKPENFTLLDGIDINDPYSTNMPLEEMFFELSIFLENEKKNPDACKVVKFEDLDKSIVNNDELYCILINGKPILSSQSFFALLIELTNIKNAHDKNVSVYNIVSLK